MRDRLALPDFDDVVFKSRRSSLEVTNPFQFILRVLANLLTLVEDEDVELGA
jgi:hypothetical protein